MPPPADESLFAMSSQPLSARNDPRASLSDEDLAEASTNSFPVVASATRRSDRMGLLAGAAIALTLGAVTFLSSDEPRRQSLFAQMTRSHPPRRCRPRQPQL